jgi:ATP-dependent helicase/nuclease subunit B
MLEIIKVKKRSDIGPYFSQFNAKDEAWLVSDLRTKLELQNRLLERDSFFIENTVLRATDLWEILFRREFPDKKVISREWGRILLSNFLKQHESSLNLNQASSSTLLEMVDFFMPVLSHPEGHDKFTDWLENHLEVKERWADWYLLVKLCYQYLFSEKDMVLASWYSSQLIQKDASLGTWDKPLWVDLGGQILWSEAEILRLLAKTMNVKIFCVEGEWQKDYSYKMRPYLHLESQTKNISQGTSQDTLEKKIQTLKFSGELAEIREAVAQVRLWLEAGTPAREIGILAPDIEKYWPVLKNFLVQEGLPANKDTVARLSSWPSVQEWLAGLRVRLRDIRAANLEMHYFQQENPSLNYDEFHSLYAHILTSEDLGRHPEIYRMYHQPLQISSSPQRDEWIVFLSKNWPAGKDTRALAVVLEELFFNCPPSLKLPLHDWFEQLESLVSRKEIVISKGDADGIHLASLLAAPSMWLKKRFFLGLSEDALKRGTSQFLSRFEVEKLYSDLGFYLENHELSGKEFELRLLADCDAEEDIYSFGGVNLTGQLQAPSGFWLKLGQNQKLQAPRRTRWDDIQSGDLKKSLNYRNFTESEMQRVSDRNLLDQDQMPAINFPPQVRPSLSASRIESYLDCPFKFATETLFKLRDLSEMDLNVHSRDYGNFVHDLFETLSLRLKEDWNDQQIDKVLQDLYEEAHFRAFHPQLWPAFKKKLSLVAKRFIQFEKEWQVKFPATRTIDREKKWSFKVGEFSVTGKIDRVDGDGEGNFVVLDYKSGVSSAYNHSQWYENNKLQLLFYIWALEKELGDGEVVGAFYYVFKNMERSRGLGVREKGQSLFPVEGRSGALTDTETKKKLIMDLENTMAEVMENIQQGLFPPKPRDEDICKPCRWKKLCRAPHLK